MTTDIINDLNTEIYTVSQFNHESRVLLETAFQQIWITGEISNLAKPASGHLYFSLKDERAAVRCACFRNNRRHTPKDLANGMQVNLLANVSLYEARGDFQLIAQRIEPAGLGTLQQRFEALKKKLQAEGLFDASRKQPIPAMPKTVGIVTSARGAAIHDILTVLKRRHANINVVVYPCLVQGELAAGQISQAIATANARNECDVLLVSRGGGSLEDLWCFNEADVAYAIANSSIPVVSAVGHEVDFTIADFVADVRAATPSAAAELISPDQRALQQQLQHYQRKLAQCLQQTLTLKRLQLNTLKARLPKPQALLQQQQQRLDHNSLQLQQAMQQLLQRRRMQLNTLQARLPKPQALLTQQQQRLKHLSTKLNNNVQYQLQRSQQRLAHASSMLQSLSPLNTVARGYAILKHNDNVVSSIQQVEPNTTLNAKLSDGELELAIINKIDRNS